MKKTNVRFNLGRGVNYMKWKIKHSNGSIQYLNPMDVQLVLSGCTLKNNKKQAQLIFDGNHKVICAWILCDEIEVKTSDFNQTDLFGKNLRYNPRKEPNWLMDGKNVDGVKFDKIESVDYKLFVI